MRQSYRALITLTLVHVLFMGLASHAQVTEQGLTDAILGRVENTDPNLDVNGDGRVDVADVVVLRGLDGIIVFDRVLLVPAAGTPLENGTDLLETLASVVDATESNQYLIQLDIGEYDLDTKTLITNPYVAIRGIDRELTSITSTASSTVILTETAISSVTLFNSGNGTSVLTAECVECELLDVEVQHTGVGGGTNTGITVRGGSELFIQDSSVFIAAANDGLNRGINVTGTGSKVILWLSEVDTEEDQVLGTIIGMDIGAGAEGEVFSSAVSTSGGDFNTAIQVAVNGLCEIDHSEVEGSTALINAGVTSSAATEFEGVRPLNNAPGMTYVQCRDGDDPVASIQDTNPAIP